MQSNQIAQQIDELTAQVSELIEVNANLKLLDTVVRRNTALFKALLANSSEGITLTGPDRRIVRVVKGLTGISAADLNGVLIESLAIPEDQPIILGCYDQLLQRHAQKVRCEIRVVRADGSTARFSVTMTDMLDDPNVQCIVWNYVDITSPE
jgi:PAS domain S-box-containing protein